MTVTHERVVATIPGTAVYSEWLEVTPEMATEFLTRNTNNRTIRDIHLDRLVQDMINGRYLTTHQGIAFDEDGVMLDGQHRCMAVVKSNKPQMMLVTYNLPTENQVMVDGGAKRLPSDFLGQYGKIKVAVVRMMLSIEDAQDKVSVASFYGQRLGRFTTAQLHDAYPRWSEQIDALLSPSFPAGRVLQGRVGQSALIAASIRFPDVAEEMLTTITANGAGLPKFHPTMALLRYRGHGRVQVPISAYLALKAFHARHFNQELSMIRQFNRQEIDLGKNTPGQADKFSWDYAAWKQESV